MLAEAADLSLPRTSQELRRLQSRGLVQAVRSGRWVRYRPVPDPQVPSAKPLLAAMKAALARNSQEADAQTIRMAKAYSHQRRLDIVRELLGGSCSVSQIQSVTGIRGMALFRHLRTLKKGGVVRRRGKCWELAPNAHPLAKCMEGLLSPRRTTESK